MHYLCEETGLFDGGSDNDACWGSGAHPNDNSCTSQANNGQCDDGGAGSTSSLCAMGTDVSDCGNRYRDTRIPCPLESRVTFFTAPASSHAAIINHACQDTGTCGSVLNNWAQSGSSVINQVNPRWDCANSNQSCDRDPLDRRAGKIFYARQASNVYFTSLRPAIEDAFRYRTRFVNRKGTGLGFTPSVCQPFSNAVPYCYDTAAIEEIADRVDCLLAIYNDPTLSADSNPTLMSYLSENFASFSPGPATGLQSRDGFEKLNAELLIMLGDQAYTNAFESRFDLAGISTAGFEGAKFEADGISLAGIAGFEMFTLHKAVQYYTLVLDRFYTMSPVISTTLQTNSIDAPNNFLSAETVTTYFDRLIRASTQRSPRLVGNCASLPKLQPKRVGSAGCDSRVQRDLSRIHRPGQHHRTAERSRRPPPTKIRSISWWWLWRSLSDATRWPFSIWPTCINPSPTR